MDNGKVVDIRKRAEKLLKKGVAADDLKRMTLKQFGKFEKIADILEEKYVLFGQDFRRIFEAGWSFAEIFVFSIDIFNQTFIQLANDEAGQDVGLKDTDFFPHQYDTLYKLLLQDVFDILEGEIDAEIELAKKGEEDNGICSEEKTEEGDISE